MNSAPETATRLLRTTTPSFKKSFEPGPGAPSRTARQPNRHLTLAILLVVLLGLVGFAVWRIVFSPITVTVASIQTNVPEQVFGLGAVGARVQSNVGFKVPGVLVALHADQRDHVKVGEVLAELDARDIEAQLAAMKAGVAQARANVDKAKADVVSATATLANNQAISERRRALAKNGFTSQEEAQTSEAAVRVASAALGSARSGVGVAEAGLGAAEAQEAFEYATLENYTLRAPYDAWVVSRNLELGSMPNPGQSVFTLVATGSIWVSSYVDERLAGRLGVGQPAEIILRSEPGHPLPGHIARIDIQSDAVNEERVVQVAFDHIPDNIHLAEQAEVVITTGTLARAVPVPPAAATDVRNGRSVVWTVENGRLARREVTVGPELLDGRLPIIDGLPSDAAVVTTQVQGMRVGRAAIVGAAP